MKRETFQIMFVDDAEMRYYRMAHLLASALWEWGAADRALAALTNLVTEVAGSVGDSAPAEPAPRPAEES